MKIASAIIISAIFLILFSCKTVSENYSETEPQLLKKGYKKVLHKDYQDAITVYTKILETNSNNAEAFAYRGLCRFHLRDFEEAIKDFNSAILIQPDYAEAYDLRGVVRAETGDKDGACSDWKKAYELGMKDAFNLIKEFCLGK